MASTVKMTIPKPLSSTAFRETLVSEMKKYYPFLYRDFAQTTEPFKKIKPEYKGKVFVLPHSIGIRIDLEGDEKSVEVWNYLDQGTKPHVIRPKRKNGKLVFKWGGPGSYSAGSRPGSIYSLPGKMAANAPTVFLKGVKHPGTKARKWREVILKEHEKLFAKWMQAAYNKAARESGHALLP